MDLLSPLDKLWGIREWTNSHSGMNGFLLALVEDKYNLGNDTIDGFSCYFWNEQVKKIIKVPCLYNYSFLVNYTSEFCSIKVNDEFQSLFYNALEMHLQKSITSFNLSYVNRQMLGKYEIFQKNEQTPYKSRIFIEVSTTNVESYNIIKSILLKLHRNVIIEKNRLSRLQLQAGNLLERDIIAELNNNPLLLFSDISEHDIEHSTKHMITNNMLTARWYKIESKQLINNFIALDAPEYLNLINSFFPSIKHNADLDTTVPNLEFLSWDIETFKKPLLFPDASKDPIMSIAYKCYKGLFLLVNREFYSENIDNFYFEKNEYCRVYNFNDEKSMLAFFLEHVRIYCKPHIIISYNGDVFDFPYLDQRCSVNGLSLCAQWGFTEHKPYSEKPLVEKSLIHYLSPFVIHIDCLKWVKRDSYLPQGSRGLKAVSRIKLNYECCEVAPELMVEYCRTKPQTMAEYNASDAVVTFALYEKYIHNFILALASIIPLNIDNILRKGAGSLCETLLMKMAVNSNVVIPCKTNDADDSWYDDEYYLINETYVGGSVEQMRTGVFKHDIKETFTIDPKVIDKLIDELDLTFMTFLQEEINPSNNIVSTNWDSIKVEITEKLNLLKSLRQFDMEPLIYHFDVGAMYPNIILTNRLQPYAIIDDQKCSKCVYSDEQQYCKKKMNWIRKSSMINLERHIVEQVEQSLKSQLFEDETKLTKNDTNTVPYYSLPVRKRKEIKVQKLKFLSAQLNKNKSQKKYEELLEANVCQRSNDFYIETVRAFRDRRMIYKKLKKESEKKLKTCDLEKQKKYENLVILYESLQLAHKCVLNSFYGYVMKRSARWHSIEMAALVTYVGGNIIKTAKNICMGVGLPLELDTDGIWTLLPKIFPTDYSITVKYYSKKNYDGDIEDISDVELKEEKLKFSYVCSMFNSETAKYFTNHNYHYFDKTKFVRTKVNSIFFEIDGPYQAMFLPASEKADKQLKKRYVVYDFKNKIVELKGFELKRRGELEMLKIFQKSIFPLYISGSCKEEIFSNLAKVAENWIRFIVSKGRNSTYKKIVLDLLTESVTVSKPVSESTRLKTFAVSTITKLSELRDDPSYLNEKGIKASFVLVSFPIHAPRVSRAIPVELFLTDDDKIARTLNKWTGGVYTNILGSASNKPCVTNHSELLSFYLDWDYYLERLSTQIFKLIIIPCVLLGYENPCSISPPAWVTNYKKNLKSTNKLTDYFTINPRRPELFQPNDNSTISSDETYLQKFIKIYKEHKYSANKENSLRRTSFFTLLKQVESSDFLVNKFKFSLFPKKIYSPLNLTEWIENNHFHLAGVDELSNCFLLHPNFSHFFVIPYTKLHTMIFTRKMNENKFNAFLEAVKDQVIQRTSTDLYLNNEFVSTQKLIFLHKSLNHFYSTALHVFEGEDPDNYMFFCDYIDPVHVNVSKNEKNFLLGSSMTHPCFFKAQNVLSICSNIDFFISGKNYSLFLNLRCNDIFDPKVLICNYFIFGNSLVSINEICQKICEDTIEKLQATFDDVNYFSNKIISKISQLKYIILPISKNLIKSDSFSKFFSQEYMETLSSYITYNRSKLKFLNIKSNNKTLLAILKKNFSKSFKGVSITYPFVTFDFLQFTLNTNINFSAENFDIISTGLSQTLKLKEACELTADIDCLNNSKLVDYLTGTYIKQRIKYYKQTHGYYREMTMSKDFISDYSLLGGLDIMPDLVHDYYVPGIYCCQILKLDFFLHSILIVIKLIDHLTKYYSTNIKKLATQTYLQKDTQSTTENSFFNNNIQYASSLIHFISTLVNKRNGHLLIRELLENPQNAEILDQVKSVLLRLFQNKLKQCIVDISKEINADLQLIYMSNTCILISIPTESYSLAKKSASSIYSLLSSKMKFKELFNPLVYHIKCGVIFNQFNRIFLDNSNQVVDIALPCLNLMHEAATFEKLIISCLLTRYSIDHEKDEVSSKNAVDMTQKHKEIFIENMRKILHYLSQMISLDSEIPVYENINRIEVPFKVLKLLLKFAKIDTFEQQQLGMYFPVSFDDLSLTSVPIIILKSVVCVHCTKIFDIYIIDDIVDCPYCSKEIMTEYLQEKIIDMVKSHIFTYHVITQPTCDLCNQRKNYITQKYCKCGGLFSKKTQSAISINQFLRIISKYAHEYKWFLTKDYLNLFIS